MKYDQALLIASTWKRDLTPYCDRIEIAGSIRRKRPEVKDIELICIPKKVEYKDLFGNPVGGRHPGFAQALQDQTKLTVVLGNAHTGRYTQVYLEEEKIKMDVFVATPENWGHILAIRTGSGDFSHKVLARGWVKAGYESVSGQLVDRKTGEHIVIREEQDLFNLIGIPFVEPENREYGQGS